MDQPNFAQGSEVAPDADEQEAEGRRPSLRKLATGIAMGLATALGGALLTRRFQASRSKRSPVRDRSRSKSRAKRKSAGEGGRDDA